MTKLVTTQELLHLQCEFLSCIEGRELIEERALNWMSSNRDLIRAALEELLEVRADTKCCAQTIS